MDGSIEPDPSDNDFKKVVETAKAAKQAFDKHKLNAFAKTSGIPCLAASETSGSFEQTFDCWKVGLHLQL